MTDGAPFVSVIVPHFCDLQRLPQCLEALRRQTYSPDCFEVIVVDNGSPDGRAVQDTASRGGAIFRYAPEKGAGPARNKGVATSRGIILAFTDSDCIPEPGWLEAGVAALTATDIVGGRMKVLPRAPAHPTAVEAFEQVFAFDNKRYVSRKGFSVSANLFCTRAVFARVGEFRTGVSEDLDWCGRALGVGYRLAYASHAIVGHPARRTWHDLVLKWRRVDAETYSLFATRPAGRLMWLLRSFALPVSAVVHTPRALTSRALTNWSQRMSALWILYRIRTWRLFDALGLLMRERTRGG